MPFNEKGQFYMTVEEANLAWRKLQREKELRIKDQLDRIQEYENQKFQSELEIEQAVLKKQKRELKERLREINKQLPKKTKKKIILSE